MAQVSNLQSPKCNQIQKNRIYPDYIDLPESEANSLQPSIVHTPRKRSRQLSSHMHLQSTIDVKNNNTITLQTDTISNIEKNQQINPSKLNLASLLQENSFKNEHNKGFHNIQNSSRGSYRDKSMINNCLQQPDNSDDVKLEDQINSDPIRLQQQSPHHEIQILQDKDIISDLNDNQHRQQIIIISPQISNQNSPLNKKPILQKQDKIAQKTGKVQDINTNIQQELDELHGGYCKLFLTLILVWAFFFAVFFIVLVLIGGESIGILPSMVGSGVFLGIKYCLLRAAE